MDGVKTIEALMLHIKESLGSMGLTPGEIRNVEKALDLAYRLQSGSSPDEASGDCVAVLYSHADAKAASLEAFQRLEAEDDEKDGEHFENTL